MNWVIYLVGSGLVFFIGVGCVLLAMVLFGVQRNRWLLILANLHCLLGVVLIALSSTPLSYWFYGIAGAATLTTLIAEQFQRPELRSRRAWLRTLTAACWLFAAGGEFPRQRLPSVPPVRSENVYIIADSVTAGVDDPRIVTWPKLLHQHHKELTVQDFSRVGATVSTAYAQAERVPATAGGLVLLEIGGNDVLGTTTYADFEYHLERLLTRVQSPHRTVLMFEVPLPPGGIEFGRIQRKLAARHGVSLIPKHVLMGILTGPSATTDSIHLSQAGRDRMASTVWAIIRPIVVSPQPSS